MATVNEATARKPRRKISLGFDRFSGLYLGAMFIIVFGIWVPDLFLTTSTLHSVAAQQAVTGIVALAILIPLAAGLYDLSVGATANLVGVTTVVLMNDHGWGPVTAIAFGMLVAIIDRLHQRVHRRQARRELVHRDVGHEIDPRGDAGDRLPQRPAAPADLDGLEQLHADHGRRLPDRRAVPARHRVRAVVADGAHADRPLPVRDRRQPRGRAPVRRTDQTATRRSRS